MIVIIEYDPFEISLMQLKEVYEVNNWKEFYNQYYDPNIILYDDDRDMIYYEIELPFIPNIGQIVETHFGLCIVTSSTLNLTGDKSHIIVTEL